MDDEPPREARYVAVKLRKRTVNLSAGIEDRVTGELIHVANASMAVRLTEWLNDESEGRRLPGRGAQHRPIRYQLAHDSSPLGRTHVLYAHGSPRVVASAPRDAIARRLQDLLIHVDYPMDKRSALSPARAHDFGERLDSLPAQTLTLPKPDPRPYWKRIVGVALWSWLPMVGLVVLFGYAVGWVIVGVFVMIWVVAALLFPLALRQ